MTRLDEKRKRFKREFDLFMNRDEFYKINPDGSTSEIPGVTSWGPEDDQLLKEVAITYIEFVSGIDGEPVLDEIMHIAKKIGQGLWGKLGDYLESRDDGEYEVS